MLHKILAGAAVLCLATTLSSHAIAAAGDVALPSTSGSPEMQALYAQRCAMCHDNPQGRIPAHSYIALILPPERIVAALTAGPMQAQAKGLSTDQIHALAEFLTGKKLGSEVQPDPQANLCKDNGAPIHMDGSKWNGWGRDPENTRYQPQPGLSADDVPRLKVKWAFALPDIAYGQPTVIGGRVYVTSRSGQVFSLNAKTGCTYWTLNVGAPVRTAISVGPVKGSSPVKLAAYFGDEKASVYAVDVATGKMLWTVQIDPHPLARITGAPQLYENRLYVPVSSLEEVSAATEKYPCCTFRGSVVALDATDGKVLWKSYAIAEAPKPIKVNAAGTQMFGPAGGAIWDTPTIDAKRKLLYVGTGDSYTDIRVDGTDSVMALDMETGARKWVMQAKRDDAWLLGCDGKPEGNCPTPLGPDFDFGASPVLGRLADGKAVILASAKSGIVYGLDPDNGGKILWRSRIGQGGSEGGIVWGPAADSENVYVAMGDPRAVSPFAPGGVTALKITTGEKLWHTPAPPPVCGWGKEPCGAAQVSAVTGIPGIVFAGSWDGHMRAYSTKDGAIVWDFDTGRSFPAVNGVPAKGGGIDGGAQIVANGALYMTSGMARGQHTGNALLAFTVDGQ